MNKLIEWAAIGSITLATVVGAFAQVENKSTTKEAVTKSLIEMERQWSESGNPVEEIELVQKIFADDFLGTAIDGTLYTKSEKIDKEKAKSSSSDGEVLSPRLDDVKVRFFSDNLAVLYGRESSIRKSKDGKQYTQRVVWTDTWLNRNSRWQIIAVQDMIVQPGK